MTLRLGLGPVFYFEWLLASRRWQLYAARVLFLLVVLAVLFFVWWAHVVDNAPQTIQEQAKLGTNFFFGIIATQLALVLLAAPAATAGSVCVDKARGTLTHLLVTDLSSAELILGKLAARLLPVLSLLLCLLPVLALNILLGGVDPVALAGAFCITVGVAVVGCTLALLLSVWGRKTHEVLLVNYLVWIVFLLAAPIGDLIVLTLGSRLPPPGGTVPNLLGWTNPFILAFAPYDAPGTTGLLEPVVYLAVCLGLSAALTGIAILTVRRVTVRQLGQASRPRRLLARLRLPGIPFGPSLDRNPVLWREWHRRRPSRWMLLVWLVYAVLCGGFVALAVFVERTTTGPRRPPNELPVFANALIVVVGLLLVSVTSSTSLAEERVRGSLDVLLTTPLTTRAIVAGKWWGAYRTVVLLAVLPGFLAGELMVLHGFRWEGLVLVPLVLAYGAALTSLGLAVATWISRLGRAVACSVTAYVLMAIAWPLAIVALFSRDNFWGPGLAMGSPFFGGAFLTLQLQPVPKGDLEHIGTWAVGWTIFYFGVAVLLYGLTLRTFNRCLGRITLRHRPWQPAPARAGVRQDRPGGPRPAPRRALNASQSIPDPGE
jgi:ABC-type transport system involved in multi-copper enzyme maturation permease subunit